MTSIRVFLRRSAHLIVFLLLTQLASRAAEIHGTVTDISGAKISGATVSLVQNGGVVATTVTGPDGGYQFLTGADGRFFVLVSAKSFRQLETPGFYAGRLDNVERSVVLEPAWVRASIVVTATGTPTPQSQTGAATTVLTPLDLDLRLDLVSALRTVPGATVVQAGQRGAQASLFLRGGASDANEVMIDGITAGDLGGRFDFGPLTTTALERAEIYRGPGSSLYGAGAASGVVSLTTPHGTTSFPSILLDISGGNLNTQREGVEVAGAHNRLDYLADYHWMQTDNDLPRNPFHVGSSAANLGWQPNGKTQLRATVHYGVSATGVPNAWQFYHVADNATQKDQNLLATGSLDHQTTASFHNLLRYGASRRREQYRQWEQSGSGDFDAYGDSLGEVVTIKGANGYSATGQAVLDYAGTYPQGHQLASNRDQLVYQGDYRVTPHLAALAGFEFEDERGAQPGSTYYAPVERTNYNYRAAVQGDFKSRFFYSLSGSLLHYSEFGTQTSPRAGVSFYAVRPRKGVLSSTRVLFNYGDAVREPALTEELSSLYRFLESNGFNDVAQQLHIGPLAAPTTRTYEGGVEQSFLSQRIVLRASYFHNQFGKQVEYVGGTLLPNILNLTDTEKQELIDALGYYYTLDYGLYVNSEAYRAQGIEATLEGGIGHNVFLRGGYTYLDAVVQRSFSSDNEAQMDGYGYSFNSIPLGAYSPLKGARPFRRPPHTAFGTASYGGRKAVGVLTIAYASRSDDSTYLAYADQDGGNSLLLPNRNLNPSYVKVDLGGSYALLPWLRVYGQLENLTNNQNAAPIGYVSLPVTVETGVKVQWGRARKQ